ncbi:phosphatidylglycerophosphatase A family protein [Muricoccus radiodurans]|uniref:phosphatidylglycerophosphatase A family protein n=1 Tax=Muricoccus radiodurans TaxID=2231721 RepID=UPI003CF6B5D0
MTRLAWLVATLGGVGRLRPAPGTVGSAVVLPAVLLGPWWCLALAIAFTLAGLWALSRLPAAQDDPGWVVVDEAAGQCLALACLPAGAGVVSVLAAFALFRAMDILKPGPVGRADRMGGALGVMLDDVLAGFFAGIVLLAARAAGWAG